MLSLSEIAFWSYVGGGLALAPVMLAFVCCDHRPTIPAALAIFILHTIGWPLTVWLFRPDEAFSISLGRKRAASPRTSMARQLTR